MPTFTWTPDQAAPRQVKLSVTKAQFGDGYQQRSADRINSSVETWDLSFTLRTKAEVLAIVAFLKARNGTANFDFVTPAGDSHKFICSGWADTYFHDGNAEITATFERVYEL